MTLISPPRVSFKGRSLVSIKDFSKEEILYLLNAAKATITPSLAGKIVTMLFFEPSTRTRLSFEAAALRLGASVTGFSGPENTSLKKGETLHDTIQVCSAYADLLVVRHPLDGAAKYAAEVSKVPVINGGDGTNEHPTQTLTDLFAIMQSQGTLQNLHIALAGDLKHGRTVHSLLKGLSLFEPRIYFCCPDGLEPPKEALEGLKENRIRFSFHARLEDILPQLDILYMTRIQAERFEGAILSSYKTHPILPRGCQNRI